MIKNPKGSRFQAWAALFIFSCVCLTAHLSPSPTTNCSVDWVTAALSISLIFSFFGTLAHFFISDKFVGQMLEGGLAFFLLIIWSACLPTIMNPNNNIAVSGIGQGSIINSNLYFFSWISFVCIILILGSYGRDVMGSRFKKAISPKTTTWLGLLAASIVLLATASKVHQDVDCVSDVGDLSYCKRTDYAIALGVFGMLAPILALVLISMGKINLTIETVLSALMFVMFTFGVGFITFGDSRPAASGGNLYFSTWIGFSLSVVLLSKCIHQIHAAQKEKMALKKSATPPPGLSDIEENNGSSDDPAPRLSDIEENDGSIPTDGAVTKGLSDVEENDRSVDGVEQPVKKVVES
jgi:hypothetical protein